MERGRLVNGVVTIEDDQQTDVYPGVLLRGGASEAE